jgi:hypothetical protein
MTNGLGRVAKGGSAEGRGPAVGEGPSVRRGAGRAASRDCLWENIESSPIGHPDEPG